jgi:type II secretory pathway component PulC
MLIRAALSRLSFVVLLALPSAVVASVPSPKKSEAIVFEGELARAEVIAIVAQGPQRFIASVQVAAHLDGRRFVGFRIEGFAPDSPLVNSRAVQPGDVILSVNREPLERPEQFMKAWERVDDGDSLEVELLRAGQRLRYRWTLVP